MSVTTLVHATVALPPPGAPSQSQSSYLGMVFDKAINVLSIVVV